MSVRNNFFTELAGANMWDVAVAIKRGNALPLDRYSVFQSLEEVNAYIKNPEGSIAYPGQILAVVGENATTVYYLDQNLAVKPVGVIPSGDSKSIEVTAEGAISLLGAATAGDGTLPMLENGALVWKTLEQIGAGDGNTLYEFTMLTKEETNEVYGFQVQAKNGNENYGDPVVIPFDVYTKSEVDTKVDGIEDRLDALEAKEDKDTTYSVKEGEKILKLEGTEFSTVAALKYLEAAGEEPAKIQLLGIDNAVVSEIDATPFIRDGMLNDVEYDAETNTLTFTWNTEAGEKSDTVVLSDIIEPYTAGNGLDLNGNEFAIKVAEGSEAFLSVDENGLKVSGIQSAIDTAKGEAATDATNKTNQALADAKEDAANLYATKEYIGTIPSNYTETTVIDYINKKAQEVLESATGGSSESAASVKNQLDTYISTNNTRVEAIEGDVEAIEGKLEGIEENAQVNVIESVKVNGSALTITDKAVDITVPTVLSQLEGYTGIDERVTAAKNQADKGVDEAGKANAAAATNADAILALQNRVTPLETTKSDHETRIIALENADSQHASEYAALAEIVGGHTTALAKKAEQTALDAVSATASANQAAITTLNETTIPGLNTEIGKKANAADVYTKTEIGAIDEGKTIVQMIEDAKTAATYDDSAIRALITAEETRATTAEGALDGRLVTVENFFKAVETPDEVIDTLAEIVSYIEGDKTGAASMLASIEQNANAIALINDGTNGILAQAKKYTDDSIAGLPFATAEKAGLVKSTDAIDGVSVAADGTMSVNRISTSKLYVPEDEELVMNGGGAAGY